jgi:hypothetical protein
MFQGLESQGTQSSNDAIELLKIFSFFHRQNIPIVILPSQRCSKPKAGTSTGKEQQGSQ